MRKQAFAVKADPTYTASPDAHEPPQMKSDALIWQHDGFVWREAFVTLPEGMLFTDVLHVPTIWKNIQQAPAAALKPLDLVTIMAFDKSWCVKGALVTDTDVTGVVFDIKPSDRIAMTKLADRR